MKNRREIRIDSALDKLYMVERFVEEISDEYYLNDNYYGNILVAVTEAFRNAVIHGNGQDRRKKVSISMEPGPDGLRFRITDEGQGFDYREFTDREKLLYQEELKGQGMILILSLADEVTFEMGGRCIQILFRINGVEGRIIERRDELIQGYFGTEVKVRKEDQGSEYR